MYFWLRLLLHTLKSLRGRFICLVNRLRIICSISSWVENLTIIQKISSQGNVCSTWFAFFAAWASAWHHPICMLLHLLTTAWSIWETSLAWWSWIWLTVAFPRRWEIITIKQVLIESFSSFKFINWLIISRSRWPLHLSKVLCWINRYSIIQRICILRDFWIVLLRSLLLISSRHHIGVDALRYLRWLRSLEGLSKCLMLHLQVLVGNLTSFLAVLIQIA